MSKVRPIPTVILTAGGTAKDVVSIIEDINQARTSTFEILGFLDDSPSLAGSTVMGLPVLGGFSKAAELHPEVVLVDALGSPSSFRRRSQLIAGLGVGLDRFATIIHPSVVISRGASIGRGCIVYPSVVLMADVLLEEHVTVLANCTINHDSVIGAYSILASGVQVAGGVHVGTSCYLGSSSLLRQGVRVGNGALIGMGAVVIRDVAEGATVVGNPARTIKSR